jgi:hypothetical protein
MLSQSTLPFRPGPPPGRVPAEFVGKARSLRDRIAKATADFEEQANRVLYPLSPRVGWPAPGRGDWLKGLVTRYRALKSPCRIDMASRIEPDGRLVINEMRLVATRITTPEWDGGDEPALSIEMIAIGTHPLLIERALLADVGLHALGRRFERARPNDDGAVLLDLAPLGYRWASTVRVGGQFTVAAARGDGFWKGVVSEVDGRALSVLLVRTFVSQDLRRPTAVWKGSKPGG